MKTATTASGSEFVIVDSSGWVEYLGDGPKAKKFATYLDSPAAVLLPSIVVYEVYKKLHREHGQTLAELFLSQAYSFDDRLIALDAELACLAARFSLEAKLAMADAIIYATARARRAHLVTCDAHFSGLPRVTIL